MVTIAPFRGLRYTLDAVGDLGRVIAPPYDVISPEDQVELYHRSPHNIVRLIFGQQSPADSDADNRYTRARQTYQEWRAAGVLARDTERSLYVCEHTFTWAGQRHTRLGVIALVQFEGDRRPDVLYHEATFEGPKADRTKLVDAVRAHLSPVFCVLPDQRGLVDAWFRRVTAAPPQLTATVPPVPSAANPAPEQLRYWIVQDIETIAAFAGAAAQESAMIADGHHRFEVAWSRRAMCPAVMTYFARMKDPALLVHGYHRVLRSGPKDAQSWARGLQGLCEIAPVAGLESLTGWLAGSTQPGRFGCAVEDQLWQVTVRAERLRKWLAKPSVEAGLADLDVSILHSLVLPAVLGQGAALSGAQAAHSGDAQISYTADPAKAVAQVVKGNGTAAWILRAIPISTIYDRSQQGIKFPQKSTYFYPKVLSGLVINPFED